jgi:hypothetical protein
MASATDAEATASAARHSARTILAEPRFHSPSVPRPLHGVLHDIGRVLEAPLNGLQELVSKLAVSTPGGSATVWGVLALIALGLCALLAAQGSRRALSRELADRSQAAEIPALSADELEQHATTAERDGHYDEAVRYRFQAGLRRLAEGELVSDAPALVNGEIARILRSQAFDELAGRFDEIVYGGASADQQDAVRSRLEWQRLLKTGARA